MQPPIAVEPERPRPDLPGEVIVRDTFEDALDAACADLYIHALNCVRSFGDFHLALSAGGPQLAMCLRLMVDPAFREIPWRRSHLWITCERLVPPGNAANGDARPAPRDTFAPIAALMADHAGIPRSNIHPVDADAADPAADYQRRLRETLAWREKGQDRLDFVLLGVTPQGTPDGLIADAADAESHDDGLVSRVEGGVTMTARLIRSARMIAFVARGEADRPGIAAAAAGDSADVRPHAGAARWYLDADACPATD